MSMLAWFGVWLPFQPPVPPSPTSPASGFGPTGPQAPAEVIDKVTLGLNFAWFVVLAAAFFMATWGLGSMAYAKKKQNFDNVNAGTVVVGYALGGAAGMTVLRGLFAFFGV